jgi:hypothetical protein
VKELGRASSGKNNGVRDVQRAESTLNNVSLQPDQARERFRLFSHGNLVACPPSSCDLLEAFYSLHNLHDVALPQARGEEPWWLKKKTLGRFQPIVKVYLF